MRSIVQFRRYEVYRTTGQFWTAPIGVQRIGIGAVKRLTLSNACVDAVERSRPGYGPTARKYLTEGHVGFAFTIDGTIAAMAWLYKNDTALTRRVSYYPLRSETAWFHADWTHPKFRGRGLHKRLIVVRAQYVLDVWGRQTALEANIDPRNAISIRNYKNCGFVRSGMLKLLKLGWWRLSWLN